MLSIWATVRDSTWLNVNCHCLLDAYHVPNTLLDSLQTLCIIWIKILKVRSYYQQFTDEETENPRSYYGLEPDICSFCYKMLLLLSVYLFHLFGNVEYDVTKSQSNEFIFISCLIPFLPQNHNSSCWLCLHMSDKEVSISAYYSTVLKSKENILQKLNIRSERKKIQHRLLNINEAER